MNIIKLCKTITGSAVLSFALMHAPAKAAVDFDSNATSPITSSPIVSGGYTFSSSLIGIFNGPSNVGAGVSNGSNMLVFANSGLLTISRSDNVRFSLSSLDVGGWANFPETNTGQLTINGYTGTPSGDPAPVLSSLPTGSFNSGVATPSFTNLSSITLQIGGFPSRVVYAAVDNLVLTAVAEPETYVMFLAGLGLMGAIARRRRAS